jgi:hypothetical protein
VPVLDGFPRPYSSGKRWNPRIISGGRIAKDVMAVGVWSQD